MAEPARFDEEITTVEALRAIIGEPNERVRNKVIDHLDDVCVRFIAASPFVVIASTGASAHLDLSPKGDPAGFVKVIDGHTLAIPDRLGNRRVDTFENVLADPRIGLIFLIPGRSETLRVSGRGRLVRDARLQAMTAHNGREPHLLLVVDVERAFMHCAKCVIRSGLWSPADWPDTAGVPTIAEAMMAHARPEMTFEEMRDRIDRDAVERLY